jgi:hypothetical protein
MTVAPARHQSGLGGPPCQVRVPAAVTSRRGWVVRRAVTKHPTVAVHHATHAQLLIAADGLSTLDVTASPVRNR